MDKFNKDIFLEYFKGDELKELEKIYIYKLYKTYSLVSSITNGKIEENKNKLREYENRIYNVDGKVFTEIDKIKLSLDDVRSLLKESNGNLNEYNNIFEEINNISELDLRDEKNRNYAKKKISIMQAKLGLKNTFFYEACQAFYEIYTNVIISHSDKTRRK